MALERVRPNEAIRAQTINTLIDGYNADSDLGGINTPPLAGRMNPLGAFGIVTIKNNSAANVPSGGILKITGIRNTALTPADTTAPEYARKLWMNCGFQLDGNTPDASTNQVAIAVLGIPAGRIGYAIVPGIFASYVQNAEIASSAWADPNVPEYTDTNTYAIPGTAGIAGLTSAASGPFKIIAATASAVITEGEAPTKFCYLVPTTVSGGHRIGEIAAVSSGVYTITSDGETFTASSPLGTLTVGTTVAFSPRIGGGWDIISAECPEG